MCLAFVCLVKCVYIHIYIHSILNYLLLFSVLFSNLFLKCIKIVKENFSSFTNLESQFKVKQEQKRGGKICQVGFLFPAVVYRFIIRS